MFGSITFFLFLRKHTFSKSFKLFVINNLHTISERYTCPLKINRLWTFPKVLLDISEKSLSYTTNTINNIKQDNFIKTKR